MHAAVLTIHLLLALALILVVLLQRSEGGGLGIGGGGGIMTSRGAATALSKVTWVIGIAFVVTSLALTVMAARDAGTGSVVDTVLPPTPTAPTARRRRPRPGSAATCCRSCRPRPRPKPPRRPLPPRPPPPTARPRRRRCSDARGNFWLPAPGLSTTYCRRRLAAAHTFAYRLSPVKPSGIR